MNSVSQEPQLSLQYLNPKSVKRLDGKSVNVSSVDGLYIHVCVHVCMYVYLFSSALIESKNTIYCSCFYKLLLYKAQKVSVN